MYLRAESSGGELFAWYTHNAAEAGMVSREAAFRATVGTTGALRAPPLLAFGDNWRLEPFVRSAPLRGRAAIDAAVAASAELARLSLPAAAPPSVQPLRTRIERRARVVASPLPLRDVVRARRLAQRSRLPLQPSHGEFHPLHLFLAEGAIWVIDWDLTDLRPAGYDLMQLWVALEHDADRAYLYDAAVGLLGPGSERDLAGLRYATLVRMIGAAFSEHLKLLRDPARGRALLMLLPEVRRAATSGQA